MPKHKAALNYHSDLNADIILMAAQRVADDLRWPIEEESPTAVTLQTPSGYARHDMTFEIAVQAIKDAGTDVSIQGKVSGMFSSTSQLDPEMEQLRTKIEAKGQQLTDQAVADGYMCPNCGALITVGSLACEKCGATLPPPKRT